MWQKCPICNGTGNHNTLIGDIVSTICNICNGKGIISELTGLPPKVVEYRPVSKNSGDFRDNCEQFENK